MATLINPRFSLSKLGELIFQRQTPYLEAETHPSIFGGISAWMKRRTAEAELNQLSDRELSDIGVTRQNIPNVVRPRR